MRELCVCQTPNITDKGNTDDLRATLDTNVMAVSWCTREVFQSLQRRKVNDGHVVIINSVVGHKVPMYGLSMYAPSKYAVTALTDVLRWEFLKKGTKTKITVGQACLDYFQKCLINILHYAEH